MLSVAFSYCCAECCFAECRYVECLYADCHYAECHYAECRYAECRYAECPGANETARKKLIFPEKILYECTISFQDNVTDDGI